MIPISIANNPELRPLEEQDYAALEARWITREIADAAHFRRVTSLYGAEMVGHVGRSGDYSGIAIPYVWPGKGDVAVYRLRRDHPDMEYGSDGKLKPRRKYLSPPGGANRLYLAPQTALSQLDDEDLPVVITEGEFKTLALWRLSWHGLGDTAEKPAFLPAGLQGVWNFRGVVGKTESEDGSRVNVKGPIADLGRITWTGRRVIILFDADIEKNDMIGVARDQLRYELEDRGATVAHFLWPPGTQASLKGIDDFLAAKGAEPAIRLLARSKTVTKRKRVPNVSAAVAGDEEWINDLLRNDKGVKPLLANALTALRHSQEWSGAIAFNEFSRRTEVLEGTPWHAEPYMWEETDDTLLAEWLQRKGIEVPPTIASQAIEVVAREHGYHPVRNYLDGLVWDGVARIDTWLEKYMGAYGGVDDEGGPTNKARYISAIGARWLISAVARVMKPSCQADYALVFQGEQRIGKSSALRVLGGDWFSDDISELGTKDSKVDLLGVWIVELGELTQIVGQRAEMERVKSFISRRTDHFRPPFGRRSADFPRQCVFAGSTNAETYFRDETGNGRFWPVLCPFVDVEGLTAVRDQLWAEARHRWQLGDKWFLWEPELIAAAEEEQDARFQRDPWDAPVWAYVLKARDDWKIGGKDVAGFTVKVEDILRSAVEKKLGEWTRQDSQRICAIMRVRGLEYVRERLFDMDTGEPLLDPKGRQRREYHFRWPDPAAAKKPKS